MHSEVQSFARESAQCNFQIASSGLRKVTTSISWTALNGTECDQKRLGGKGAGSMLVEEGPLMSIVE